MAECRFAEGLIVKEGADFDWQVCKLSVKKEEFIEFLNGESGDWVNFDINIGKSGKIYAKVDDWKPNTDNSGSGEGDVPF